MFSWLIFTLPLVIPRRHRTIKFSSKDKLIRTHSSVLINYVLTTCICSHWPHIAVSGCYSCPTLPSPVFIIFPVNWQQLPRSSCVKLGGNYHPYSIMTWQIRKPTIVKYNCFIQPLRRFSLVDLKVDWMRRDVPKIKPLVNVSCQNNQ